jgi:hypothetical protein
MAYGEVGQGDPSADRNAFAGPKREINRPDMKSAQRTAFEDVFTCGHAFSFPSWRKPRPDRPAGLASRRSTRPFVRPRMLKPDLALREIDGSRRPYLDRVQEYSANEVVSVTLARS